MHHLKLETFIFVILLSFLSACGGSSYGGGGGSSYNPPPQHQEFPAPDTFSTRINNNLLISGDKCRGGETTDNNGQTFTCQPDQYLLTVDVVNVCDTSGTCTHQAVTPVIAELQNANVSSPDFSYFNIVPKSPVSAAQNLVLKTVQVKVSPNGDASVVLKKP